MRYAITHPGPVHRDDLLCMAVIANTLHCPIQRRDPTLEELDDPTVLVVDIGDQHDPEKNNYDHHQLDRNAESEWAFGLMLRGIRPDLAVIFGTTNWFSTSRLLDAKGPFAVAKELSLPTMWTQKLWSPIEEAVTTLLENKASIAPGSDLYIMLELLGGQLISTATTWYTALVELREQVQVLDIKGLQVLYVHCVLQGATERAMSKLQTENWPNAAAMVSYDNRGEGHSFYRFKDHPRVDFSRLEVSEKILFAHAGGFIAKSKQLLDILTVIELIKAAII